MKTEEEKKVSTKPKKSGLTSKKDYELTTKEGGKLLVSKNSVERAKKKEGVFKSIPDYKGKVLKDGKGNIYGVKTHDGKVHRAISSDQRNKVMEKLKYDQKLYVSSKKKREGVQKRFSTAVPVSRSN